MDTISRQEKEFREKYQDYDKKRLNTELLKTTNWFIGKYPAHYKDKLKNSPKYKALTFLISIR